MKTFPFEIRDWDIEKHQSIDMADSSGQSVDAYLANSQIVAITLSTNPNRPSYIEWLSDKSRQFFDGMFGIKQTSPKLFSKNFWKNLFQELIWIVYINDLFNVKNLQKRFFTVIFENLNLETLNILFFSEKIFVRKVKKS